MVTRGVASIRSPVKNLQEFSPAVTHDKFVRAMVQAFREEYHVGEPVRPSNKVISIIFQLITAPSLWPGAICGSGGCDKHTIHPR
jgi:lipoate-protein ligase A